MAKDNTWIVSVLAVVLFILATTIVFGPNVLRHFRNKKIMEIGVDATARIVEVVDTGKRYNYNQEVLINLTVHPAGGKPYDAAVVMVASPSALQALQPGATVKVKYNPDNPALVTITQ